ncbi:fibronectin type III domain-containing protein [Tumebacillus flagellatus]|nr:fibronectin type III domain-containing protein [Tumebacillus flagellatus]
MAWLILSAFAFSMFPSAAQATTGYTYIYDKNNRLTRIDVNGVATYSFTYDKNGNLLKIEQVTGRVSNLTVTTGNGTATLQWAPPQTGTVTGYRVYRKGVLVTTLSAVTSYTFTGLVTGQYTFSITPVFDYGDGVTTTTEPIQVYQTLPNSGGGMTPGDPTPAS